MPLTVEEKHLAATLEFDAAICDRLKELTGAELSQTTGLDEQYKSYMATGVAAAADRSAVVRIVVELQSEISQHGYRAFWSERCASNGAHLSEEVVLLKTTDHFAILDLRRTNGANYDVYPEDVVATLKSWEGRSRFQVVGAADSWVALQFQELPMNICAFAEEVYEFCPDCVEQGVGFVRECDQPEVFAAARQLCPQLSQKMQEKLDQKRLQFEAFEMPQEMRESLMSSTPTDMGIRLLAYHLKQDMEVFLWWD